MQEFGSPPVEPEIFDNELRRHICELEERFNQNPPDWPLKSTKVISLLSENSAVLPATYYAAYEHLARGSEPLLQMVQEKEGVSKFKLTLEQTLALAAVAYTLEGDSNRYGKIGLKPLVADTKERLGENNLAQLLITPAERKERKKQKKHEMKAGEEVVVESSQDESEESLKLEVDIEKVQPSIGVNEVRAYMNDLVKHKRADIPDDVLDAIKNIFVYRSQLKGKDAEYSLSKALIICEKLLRKNPKVEDIWELEERLSDALEKAIK